MKEILAEEAPGIHVSISSEIVPAMKEYERSATTAVNAHLAPLLTTYLEQLESGLAEKGLKGSLFVMQSLGGAMRVGDSERRAANTLVSGPAGGVVAARFLGDAIDQKNIICADVGGTSFDVSLIVDGEPLMTSQSTINQYTLLVPTLDIVSIGAGGGSIGWVDLGRLRVGPQSAGADPGPACYGRGGEEPTVTDANVVLGYIDPDYFLGGKITLDRDLAAKAIREKVAEPLGMTVRDAAAGIVEIANHHMSDLMRKMTIERGHDPRDFVVYAFGGAGPLHGGAFGRELGAKEILFPLGDVASAFSALGLAVSDLTTVAQITELALAPFDPAAVTRHFDELEAEAIANLGGAGVDDADVQVQRILELRYKGQVHQVDTPVPGGTVDAEALDRVLDDFERRYEAQFGPGSGFREAGVELVTYRVLGTAVVERSRFQPQEVGPADPGDALIGRESLFWRELGREAETAIYGPLKPGMEFEGPAVIRLPSTTGLVHPGQRVRIDEYGNVRIKASE
jgi:N-methylhydantoinase A